MFSSLLKEAKSAKHGAEDLIDDKLCPTDGPDELLSDSWDRMMIDNAVEEATAFEQALCTILRTYGVTPELSHLLKATSLVSADVLPTPARIAQCDSAERVRAGALLADQIQAVISTESLANRAASKLRSELHVGKKTIFLANTAMLTLANLAAQYLLTKNGQRPGLAHAVGAGVAAATVHAGVIYAVDKAVNASQVYGSHAVVERVLTDMHKRDKAIQELAGVPIPTEDSEYPEYAEHLRSFSGILHELGYTLSDTYVSFKKASSRSSAQGDMVAFSESGWTAENFKSALSEIKERAEQYRSEGPLMEKLHSKIDNIKQGMSGDRAGVMINRLTTLLTRDQINDARFLARSIKSVSRFFSHAQLRVIKD